jgi:hypothetical protein
MAEPTDRDERADEQHELEKGRAEDPGRKTGSAPSERTPERHLEIEPGVEQHAGEDAGQVPRDDEDR